MSSRLATKRVSRAASSSMEASRSPRSSAGILSPSWRRVVTAPVIEDSGVRRSCDSDDSSVVRNFSFSSSAALRTASPTSSERSMAIAVCSSMAVSARSSSGEIGSSAAVGLEAADADGAARRRSSGRNWNGEIGQGVGAPARRLALGKGPARGADFAGGEIVHRRPGGGETKFAALRASATGHARLEPLQMRRPPPRARRRASARRRACAKNHTAVRCCARVRATISDWSCTRPASEPVSTATTRNTSSESSSSRLGDGERVDRRDEEEIIGRETTGTTPRSPTTGRSARRRPAPRAGRPSTDWAAAASAFKHLAQADRQRHRDDGAGEARAETPAHHVVEPEVDPALLRARALRPRR